MGFSTIHTGLLEVRIYKNINRTIPITMNKTHVQNSERPQIKQDTLNHVEESMGNSLNLLQLKKLF